MKRRALSDRVRGHHGSKSDKSGCGSYDLERRGEEVFCSNCGAGPLERTNGTPVEFDYANGKGSRIARPRRGSSRDHDFFSTGGAA